MRSTTIYYFAFALLSLHKATMKHAIFVLSLALVCCSAEILRPAPDCVPQSAFLENAYNYYTDDFTIKSSYQSSQAFNTFYTKVRFRGPLRAFRPGQYGMRSVWYEYIAIARVQRAFGSNEIERFHRLCLVTRSQLSAELGTWLL